MLKASGSVLSALWAFLLCPVVLSADFTTTVPMRNKGAATYYVSGEIEGVGAVELLVDTGSGYSTIGQDTLDTLVGDGRASYVKKLTGIMADGSKMTVPVYRISGMVIGTECWLGQIEAAVFPDSTRFILGLSALRQAAPFIFSMGPPELVLSNCGNAPTAPQHPPSTAQIGAPEAEANVAMADAEVVVHSPEK